MQQKTFQFERTPQSQRSPRNFPNISKSRDRATPRTTRQAAVQSQETSVFSYVNDTAISSLDKPGGHKFFNLAKKQWNFSSGKQSKRSKSINLHAEGAVREAASLKGGQHTHWEILQRLEASELRISSKGDFPRTANVIAQNHKLWEKCQQELIPLIKAQNKQAAVVIKKVSGHTQLLFKQLKNLYDKKSEQSEKQKKSAEEKIKALSQKIKEIQDEKKEGEKRQKQEYEVIKKEIDDLFGGEDQDYLTFKNRSTQFHSIRPAGTSSVLKQLYRQLTKQRTIPAQKEFDISAISPEDLQNGLYQNFLNLQRETAARIIQLYQMKATQSNKDTQTLVDYIPPELYREVSSQAQKIQLQFTNVSQKLEQLKQQFAEKVQTIEKLESQRQQILMEAAQNRREAESAEKELKSTKRDNEFLLKDKWELEKQLEAKFRDLNWFEDKHEQQNKKIKDLTKEVEKASNTLRQRDKKIDTLKKRLLNNNTIVDSDQSEQVEQTDSYASRRTSVARPKKITKEESSQKEIPSFGIPEIPIMENRPRRQRKPYQTRQESLKQENTQNQPRNQQQTQEGKFGIIEQRSIQQSPKRQIQPRKRPIKGKKKGVKSKQDSVSSSQVQNNRRLAPPSTVSDNRTSIQQQSLTESDRQMDQKYRKQGVSQKGETQSRDTQSRARTSHTRGGRRPVIQDHYQENPEPEQALAGSPLIRVQRSQKTKKSTSPKRHTRKDTRKKTKFTLQEELDDDFMEERDSWAQEALNSSSLGHGGSSVQSNIREIGILQEIPVSIGNKRKSRDAYGNQIILIDRGVLVNLGYLSPKLGDFKSIGVQFDWENPERYQEEQKQQGKQLYLLPFNPNSIYGLRGDSYFKGRPQTFSTQPRIPELASSIVFKNTYRVDEKRIINLNCL